MDQAQSTKLDTLSRSIVFGTELLADLEKEENLEEEHKVIIALYKQLLEQLDSNFVLADHNLYGPSTVMIRAAFETYLAIKYILKEKKFIKDRALSYYISFVKAQHELAERKLNESDPLLEREGFEKTLQWTTEVSLLPKFKKVADEWDKKKQKLLDKNKPDYEPKWYSMFNGPTSLKQLVNSVGDKQDYEFYGLLSKQSHGYQALSGLNFLDIVNKPFSLKPIRGQKDVYHEELARALCTTGTYRIVSVLLPQYEKRFVDFGKEIGLIPRGIPYQTKTGIPASKIKK